MAARKPTELPTISVVIPTRGRPELLQRCLAAVLADEGTGEVVVVIDGPDPATTELVASVTAQDDRVRATDVPAEPQSLARVQRARDHGAGIASGEVLLAMDDDVVAQPGLVSGHAQRHAETERAVVVGYMPVAGESRWPFGQAPVRFYSRAYEAHCVRYRSDPGSILRQLWGGNFSVRRSDWLKASERPRVATTAFEDLELGLLMREEGLEGIFDPRLRADHHYRRTLRGFVRRAEVTVAERPRLVAAHPEHAGEVEELQPRRLHSLLLRLSKSRFGWLAVRSALMLATTLAAACRATRLEDRGAELLWRIAEDRAAFALADSPNPPDRA